jgi:hypothetical protein
MKLVVCNEISKNLYSFLIACNKQEVKTDNIKYLLELNIKNLLAHIETLKRIKILREARMFLLIRIETDIVDDFNTFTVEKEIIEFCNSIGATISIKLAKLSS